MAENPFEDLVPAEKSQSKPAPQSASSGINMFDELIPKEHGLDKDRPEQHLPGGDSAGAVIAGINKANPFMLAPKAGAWLMNKALTATGVQPTDNHQVYKDMDALVTPNPESTGLSRTLQSAGELAMAAPSMGSGLEPLVAQLPSRGSLAAENAPMLARAANSIKNFGNTAVRSMAENPDSTGKYLLQNFGAGAGMGAMHEADKDAPGYISAPLDTAAGIAGGFTPDAAMALPKAAKAYWQYGITPNMMRAGVNIPKNIILNNTPDSAMEGDGVLAKFMRGMKDKQQAELNEKALPAAAAQFQDIMTPEARANLQQGQQLRATIPGFNPTLAETTGVPSTVATQRGVEGGASGNILDQFVKRKQDSENAIQNYAERAAPMVNNADFTDAAKRRVEAAAAPVEDAQAKVQGQREAQANAIPSVNAFDNGSYLRDRLESLRSAKQDEMTKLSDDLGLNDAKNLRVSRDGLQKAVQAALPSRFAVNTSPTMKAISKLDQGDDLSFKDAKYFMEQLGQEARLAAKQGNNQDARIIGNARQNIDGYLTDEWAPALKIGDKYQAFRDRYLNEYVNRFDKGAAKDVTGLGSDQRYRTDNEDVAGTFFRPGDTTAAHDFHTTFGGDPKALDALHSYAMDDLRQSAVKDGVLDPKAMQKWLTANKDNLAEFPTLQKDVGDIHSVAKGLADRQAALATRQEAVQDSALAQSLKDRGTTLDTMLSDPATMQRVVGKMTSDEKQAASRALWQKASATAKEDPASMKQFMDDHSDAFGAIMQPEHIKALNDIQKAWEMNARTPTPTGVADQGMGGGFSKLKDVTGSSAQQMLSRFFAVQSGRTGWKYTLGDMIARAGINLNNKQSQALMDRALYDKDFAEQLANFVKTPKPTPVETQKMKSYMFNSGVSALSGDNDDSD